MLSACFGHADAPSLFVVHRYTSNVREDALELREKLKELGKAVADKARQERRRQKVVLPLASRRCCRSSDLVVKTGKSYTRFQEKAPKRRKNNSAPDSANAVTQHMGRQRRVRRVWRRARQSQRAEQELG